MGIQGFPLLRHSVCKMIGLFLLAIETTMSRAKDKQCLTQAQLMERVRFYSRIFDDCLRQIPDWKWARKGRWYSKCIMKNLSSPIKPARLLKLGYMSKRRFRCSHPPVHKELGDRLIQYVQVNFGDHL